MSAARAKRLLEELVYELLDAHSDTIPLVAAPAKPAWEAQPRSSPVPGCPLGPAPVDAAASVVIHQPALRSYRASH
jgi:hypothetical protein